MDDYDEDFEDGFEDGFENEEEYDDEEDEEYDDDDEDEEEEEEGEYYDEEDGDEELDDYAQYGRFPFDIFVLEKWDYSQPLEMDSQQWGALVKEFLGLSPKQRESCRDKSSNISTSDGPNPLLAPHNIARVLEPHQTIRERNVTCHASILNPIWVRTCYEPELEEHYQQLRGQSDVGFLSWGEEMVLEDASIYDASPGYEKEFTLNTLMTRMPSLACSFDDYTDGYKADSDDDMAVASSETRTLIYVVDKAALREGLVRNLWLDSHGKCVWGGKIKPDNIAVLTSMLNSGQPLSKAIADGRFESTAEPGIHDYKIRPKL